MTKADNTRKTGTKGVEFSTTVAEKKLHNGMGKNNTIEVPHEDVGRRPKAF